MGKGLGVVVGGALSPPLPLLTALLSSITCSYTQLKTFFKQKGLWLMKMFENHLSFGYHDPGADREVQGLADQLLQTQVAIWGRRSPGSHWPQKIIPSTGLLLGP